MNMSKIKEFIIKVFHIRTYKEEFDKLIELDRKNTELYESIITSYKKDLDLALGRIKELEDICKNPLSIMEDTDRIRNKAYAEGRKDAYAEMGIRALEARVDGNVICIDEEGKFVEVITTPTLEEVCEESGIDINTLENVS